MTEVRPWALSDTGSVASLVAVVRRRALGKTSIVEHVSKETSTSVDRVDRASIIAKRDTRRNIRELVIRTYQHACPSLIESVRLQSGVSEARSSAYPCRIVDISPGDIGTV